jgi:hypothetical protein
MSISLRAHSLVGWLLCILGMILIIISTFLLPLFAIPEGFGGGEITAWYLFSGSFKNMQAHETAPLVYLVVILPLVPLFAAFVFVLLRLTFLITAKRIYLYLFYGVLTIGAIPLFLLLVSPPFLISARTGYLGGFIGYGLLLISTMESLR